VNDAKRTNSAERLPEWVKGLRDVIDRANAEIDKDVDEYDEEAHGDVLDEFTNEITVSRVEALLDVVEASARCIELLSFNWGGFPGPNGATNPQLGARDWLRKKLEALHD
jgi:hypothetical protein